jgi:hypothetical protein
VREREGQSERVREREGGMEREREAGRERERGGVRARTIERERGREGRGDGWPHGRLLERLCAILQTRWV